MYERCSTVMFAILIPFSWKPDHLRHLVVLDEQRPPEDVGEHGPQLRFVHAGKVFFLKKVADALSKKHSAMKDIFPRRIYEEKKLP